MKRVKVATITWPQLLRPKFADIYREAESHKWSEPLASGLFFTKVMNSKSQTSYFSFHNILNSTSLSQ